MTGIQDFSKKFPRLLSQHPDITKGTVLRAKSLLNGNEVIYNIKKASRKGHPSGLRFFRAFVKMTGRGGGGHFKYKT